MPETNPFLKFIPQEPAASAVTEGPMAGSGVPQKLLQIMEQNGGKLPPELQVKRGKLTDVDLDPYLKGTSEGKPGGNPFLKFVPGGELPPEPPAEVPGQDLEAARAAAPKGFVPNMARTLMGLQGQMDAAVQGVNPVKLPQGRLIGEYTETDSGPAVKIARADGKNKYVKFSPEKFAVQRDLESGRMMVYQRTPESEAGALENIGRVVSLGANTNKLPTTSIPQAPSKIDQLRTVGVTPTPYSTGDRLPSMLGSFAEQQLMGAPPMLKAQQKIAEQSAGGVRRGIEQFGGGQASADIGLTLAEAADKYSKNTGSLARNIFDPVDRALGYKNGVRQIGPNGERLSFNIDIPQTRNLLQRFQETGVKGIDDLLSTGGLKSMKAGIEGNDIVGIDYEILKQLRSKLGEGVGAYGGAGAPIGDKEARQLYAAITQDLKNGLPPEARQAFVKANAEYAKIAATNKKLQQAFKGAGTVPKTGEQAFDTLYRALTGEGDAALVAKAKGALTSDEWDNVISSVMAKAARPSPSAAQEVQNLGMSIEDFYKNINKIKQKPALMDAAFGADGPRRKFVDALLEVGDMVKKSGATRNRSNTGGVMWTGGSIASGIAGGAAYGATQSPLALALPVAFQLAAYGTAKAVNAPIANGLDTVLKLAKKSDSAVQFANRMRLLAESNPYVKQALSDLEGQKQ